VTGETVHSTEPINDARLHVEEVGPAGAPTIVFSHGLLFGSWMFAPQMAAFGDRLHCLAYDHRGQGGSWAPRTASYSMEAVYYDAVALLEARRLGPVHWCGLSMGAIVGLMLAARRPDLIRSLILISASADPEPPEALPKYRLMNIIARWFGPRPVAGRLQPILFSRSVLTDPARAADVAEWRGRLLALPRAIWRPVRGVISRGSIEDELSRITAPTLLLAGEEDLATPPARAERIRASVPHARLVRVPQAGHSASLEQPGFVIAAMDDFLAEIRGFAPPAG
jgi:pimeloyl-ACP methyl ester carboxylesterase